MTAMTRKKLKVSLVLIMAIALVFALVYGAMSSKSLSEAAYADGGEQFTLSYSEGTYTVEACNFYTPGSGPLVVPSTYDDGTNGLHYVTIIAALAFENCEATAIVLPTNLVTIVGTAFQGSNITTISIPASVTSIGDQAFNGCSDLEEVVFEADDASATISLGLNVFSGTGVNRIVTKNHTVWEHYSSGAWASGYKDLLTYKTSVILYSQNIEGSGDFETLQLYYSQVYNFASNPRIYGADSSSVLPTNNDIPIVVAGSALVGWTSTLGGTIVIDENTTDCTHSALYPVFKTGLFSSGNGTEGNPYKMSNVTDLVMMNKLVNNTFEVDGIVCPDTHSIYGNKYYQVLASIETTALAWTPLADFSGNINGGNSIISGLVLQSATSVGFIGNLTGGVLTNIVFRDCVTANSGSSNVGTAVGLLSSGTVKNVHTTVTDKATTKLRARSSFGGLVGTMNGGVIESSSNNIDLVAAMEADTVGGIVGSVTAGTISKVFNNGNISAKSKNSNVGGVVGKIQSTAAVSISYVYNIGNIEGDTSDYIGGIVGTISARSGDTLSEAYNVGKITGVGADTTIDTLVGQLNSKIKLNKVYYASGESDVSPAVGITAGIKEGIPDASSVYGGKADDKFTGIYAVKNLGFDPNFWTPSPNIITTYYYPQLSEIATGADAVRALSAGSVKKNINTVAITDGTTHDNENYKVNGKQWGTIAENGNINVIYDDGTSTVKSYAYTAGGCYVYDELMQTGKAVTKSTVQNVINIFRLEQVKEKVSFSFGSENTDDNTCYVDESLIFNYETTISGKLKLADGYDLSLSGAEYTILNAAFEVGGNLSVSQSTLKMTSVDFDVKGNATFSNTSRIDPWNGGSFTVVGNLTMTGLTVVSWDNGTLNVTGSANLTGSTFTALNNLAATFTAATLSNTTVTSWNKGSLTATGELNLIAGSNLTLKGTALTTAALSVNASILNYSDFLSEGVVEENATLSASDTISLTNGATVVLDGIDVTSTASISAFSIAGNGTALTIKGGSITAGSCVAISQEGGNLTLDKDAADIIPNVVGTTGLSYKSGKLMINALTIKGSAAYGVVIDTTSADITINDCDAKGLLAAIYVKNTNGEISILGGTFGTTESAVGLLVDSMVEITGGTSNEISVNVSAGVVLGGTDAKLRLEYIGAEIAPERIGRSIVYIAALERYFEGNENIALYLTVEGTEELTSGVDAADVNILADNSASSRRATYRPQLWVETKGVLVTETEIPVAEKALDADCFKVLNTFNLANSNYDNATISVYTDNNYWLTFYLLHPEADNAAVGGNRQLLIGDGTIFNTVFTNNSKEAVKGEGESYIILKNLKYNESIQNFELKDLIDLYYVGFGLDGWTKDSTAPYSIFDFTETSGNKIISDIDFYPVWSEYFGTSEGYGCGTDASPFAISTYAELKTLSALSNNTKLVGRDSASYYNGLSYKLTNDISGDAAGFDGIGYAAKHFTGKFNGQENTISGITINTNDDCGLFDYLSGATISNLTVEASINYAKPSTVTTGSIGGVAGSSVGSIFSKVYAKTNITVVNNAGQYFRAGGIVGTSDGDKLEYVGLLSDSTLFGAYYLGGIVGYYVDYGTSLVQKSINIASNVAASMAGATNGMVGGIVGVVETGDSTKLELSNVYNTADISVPGEGLAGGIIGGVISGYSVGNVTTITNAYNTGTISANTAGGIVGRTSVIEIALKNLYNIGNVETEGLGGFVGALVGNAFSNTVTEENAYYNKDINIGLVDVGSGEVSSLTKLSTIEMIFVENKTNFSGTYSTLNFSPISWYTLAQSGNTFYYPGLKNFDDGLGGLVPPSVTVYTVEFDVNGGGAVKPVLVAENTTAIEPAKPTYSGYYFGKIYYTDDFTTDNQPYGWTVEDLAIGTYNSGKAYDWNTVITAEKYNELVNAESTRICLYATWTKYNLELTRDDSDIENRTAQVSEARFAGTDVTVTIPDTFGDGSGLVYPLPTAKVIAISNETFLTKAAVLGVVFSGNLITIGDRAFSGCENLTHENITFPAKLQTIGEAAFTGCYNLTGNLVLGNSIVSIGADAFSGTGFTGSLTLPNNASYTVIQQNTFNGVSFTGSLSIPSAITAIRAYAFNGGDFSGALNVLGNTLTEIGDYAFSGNNFSEIKLKNADYAVGERALFIDTPHTIYIEGSSAAIINVTDGKVAINNAKLGYIIVDDKEVYDAYNGSTDWSGYGDGGNHKLTYELTAYFFANSWETVEANSVDAVATEAYYYDQLYPSLPGTPIKTGYDFRGWAFDSDEDSTFISTSTRARHNTAIYAVWYINSDTVLYVDGDGIGGSDVTGDGSAAYPFASFTRAYEMINPASVSQKMGISGTVSLSGNLTKPTNTNIEIARYTDASMFIVTENATVSDLTIDIYRVNNSAASAIVLNNEKTCSLSNLTINNSGSNANLVAVENNSTLTILGGVIYGNVKQNASGSTVLRDGGSVYGNVTNNGSFTLSLAGYTAGSITGSVSSGGTFNMADGFINGNVTSTGTFNMNGGTIGTDENPATVTISGDSETAFTIKNTTSGGSTYYSIIKGSISVSSEQKSLIITSGTVKGDVTNYGKTSLATGGTIEGNVTNKFEFTQNGGEIYGNVITEKSYNMNGGTIGREATPVTVTVKSFEGSFTMNSLAAKIWGSISVEHQSASATIENGEISGNVTENLGVFTLKNTAKIYGNVKNSYIFAMENGSIDGNVTNSGNYGVTLGTIKGNVENTATGSFTVTTSVTVNGNLTNPSEGIVTIANATIKGYVTTAGSFTMNEGSIGTVGNPVTVSVSGNTTTLGTAALGVNTYADVTLTASTASLILNKGLINGVVTNNGTITQNDGTVNGDINTSYRYVLKKGIIGDEDAYVAINVTGGTFTFGDSEDTTKEHSLYANVTVTGVTTKFDMLGGTVYGSLNTAGQVTQKSGAIVNGSVTTSGTYSLSQGDIGTSPVTITTLTVSGGSFTFGLAENAALAHNLYAAVTVNSGAVFTVNGGYVRDTVSVSGTMTQGINAVVNGKVTVAENGTYTINAGTVAAVDVSVNGTFEMKDGSIVNNNVVNNGTATMTKGQISGKVDNNAGGTFTFIEGNVTGDVTNKGTMSLGGVAISGKVVNTANLTITGNVSILNKLFTDKTVDISATDLSNHLTVVDDGILGLNEHVGKILAPAYPMNDLLGYYTDEYNFSADTDVISIERNPLKVSSNRYYLLDYDTTFGTNPRSVFVRTEVAINLYTYEENTNVAEGDRLKTFGSITVPYGYTVKVDNISDSSFGYTVDGWYSFTYPDTTTKSTAKYATAEISSLYSEGEKVISSLSLIAVKSLWNSIVIKNDAVNGGMLVNGANYGASYDTMSEIFGALNTTFAAYTNPAYEKLNINFGEGATVTDTDATSFTVNLRTNITGKLHSSADTITFNSSDLNLNTFELVGNKVENNNKMIVNNLTLTAALTNTINGDIEITNSVINGTVTNRGPFDATSVNVTGQIENYNTFYISGGIYGSTINNSGVAAKLEISTATVHGAITTNGDFDITAGGSYTSLNVTGGTANIAAGTFSAGIDNNGITVITTAEVTGAINNTNSLTINAGTYRELVTSTSVLNIANGSFKSLDVTSGTAAITTATFSSDVENSGTSMTVGFADIEGNFTTNSGTVTITDMEVAGSFESVSGTVNVTDIEITNDLTVSAGKFTVTGNAEIGGDIVNNGNMSLANATVVGTTQTTGTGNKLSIGTGEFTGAITSDGDFDITVGGTYSSLEILSGTADIVAGTFTGSVTNAGTMVITTANVTGEVASTGTIRIKNGTYQDKVSSSNALTIENGAFEELDVTAGTSTITTATFSSNVTNNGTSMTVGFADIEGNFTSHSTTVTITDMEVAHNFTSTSGTVTVTDIDVNGNLSVSAGTMSVSSDAIVGGNIVNNGVMTLANVTVTGTTSSTGVGNSLSIGTGNCTGKITSDTDFDITVGGTYSSLEILSGTADIVAGTFTGSVTNAGTMIITTANVTGEVASSGTLTIKNGTYQDKVSSSNALTIENGAFEELDVTAGTSAITTATFSSDVTNNGTSMTVGFADIEGNFTTNSTTVTITDMEVAHNFTSTNGTITVTDIDVNGNLSVSAGTMSVSSDAIVGGNIWNNGIMTLANVTVTGTTSSIGQDNALSIGTGNCTGLITSDNDFEITVGGTYSSLDILSGTADIKSGTFTGSISNAGTAMTIITADIGGNLTNTSSGTINVTYADIEGNLSATDGAIIIADADVTGNIVNDASMTITDITVDGTVSSVNAGSVLNITTGTFNNAITANNQLTITAGGSYKSLAILGGTAQVTRGTISEGIANSGDLTLNGPMTIGAAFTQSEGSASVNGDVIFNGTVTLNNGTFDSTGGSFNKTVEINGNTVASFDDSKFNAAAYDSIYIKLASTATGRLTVNDGTIFFAPDFVDSIAYTTDTLLGIKYANNNVVGTLNTATRTLTVSTAIVDLIANVVGDIDFVADYGYYVFFNNNVGADGNEASRTATMIPQRYAIGVAQALSANTFVYETLVDSGNLTIRTFVGWSVASDTLYTETAKLIADGYSAVVTEATIADKNYVISEGRFINLYAIYRSVEFTISYVGDDVVRVPNTAVTVPTAPLTYVYGSEINLSAASRDGYSFNGWKLTGTVMPEAYRSGNGITMDSLLENGGLKIGSAFYGNVEVTATWSHNVFNTIYLSDLGSDDNVGNSELAPVKSFAQAKYQLNDVVGAKIILTDTVTINNLQEWALANATIGSMVDDNYLIAITATGKLTINAIDMNLLDAASVTGVFDVKGHLTINDSDIVSVIGLLAEVANDAILTVGNSNIEGDIQSAGRVTLTSGVLDGDITATNGLVNVVENMTVEGITASATALTIAGIAEDVTIAGGSLVVTEGASLGALVYTGGIDANITGATIASIDINGDGIDSSTVTVTGATSITGDNTYANTTADVAGDNFGKLFVNNATVNVKKGAFNVAAITGGTLELNAIDGNVSLKQISVNASENVEINISNANVTVGAADVGRAIDIKNDKIDKNVIVRYLAGTLVSMTNSVYIAKTAANGSVSFVTTGRTIKSNIGATILVNGGQTYTVDTIETAMLSLTSLGSGYRIKGWKQQEEGGAETSILEATPELGEFRAAVVINAWVDNRYIITFNSNYTDAEMTNETYFMELTYNSPIAINDVGFTYAGYTFQYWLDSANGTKLWDDAEVVTYTALVDTTVYAKWTPNTDTPYVVRHYLQPLNGSLVEAEYTLVSESGEENKTGTTDTVVTALARSYTGFTAKANSKAAKVLGNGTTVINMYYNRNVMTVTFTDSHSRSATKTVLYEGTLNIASFPSTSDFITAGYTGAWDTVADITNITTNDTVVRMVYTMSDVTATISGGGTKEYDGQATTLSIAPDVEITAVNVSYSYRWYQWLSDSDRVLIPGQTNKDLDLFQVAESGHYIGQVIVTEVSAYEASKGIQSRDCFANMVTVTINKGTYPYVAPTVADLTYTPELSLASCPLPNGFTWNDASTKLDANAPTGQFYYCKYTPIDAANYVVSENISVKVTVNKTNPIYTVPSVEAVNFVTGLVLGDIDLPEGFTWDESSTPISVTTGRDFTVTYTPSDIRNYRVVNDIVVRVVVNKSAYDMSGVVLKDASYVYDGGEKSLAIAGILPVGVSVSYTNNAAKDPGKYTVTASFDGDEENYQPISPIYATLTIKRTVFIEKSEDENKPKAILVKELGADPDAKLSISKLAVGSDKEAEIQKYISDFDTESAYLISLINADSTFAETKDGEIVKVSVAIPEELSNASQIKVYVKATDGVWEERVIAIENGYINFTTDAFGEIVYLIPKKGFFFPWWGYVSCSAAVIGIIFWIAIAEKRRKFNKAKKLILESNAIAGNTAPAAEDDDE